VAREGVEPPTPVLSGRSFCLDEQRRSSATFEAARYVSVKPDTSLFKHTMRIKDSLGRKLITQTGAIGGPTRVAVEMLESSL